LRHEGTRDQHADSLTEKLFYKNLLPVVPDSSTPSGRSLDLRFPGSKEEILKKWDVFTDRGKKWTKDNIPLQKARAHKPWISAKTLELIDVRSSTNAGDLAWEHLVKNGEMDCPGVTCSLTKQIKKSARSDRKKYVATELGKGEWKSLRVLKPFELDSTAAVRDDENCAIPTHQLPEGFARHYETCHWTPLPNTGPSCQMPDEIASRLTVPWTDQELPLPDPALRYLMEDDFSPGEIANAARKAKDNKSAGPSGVPNEYWKLLAVSSAILLLTAFFNTFLQLNAYPELWSFGIVVPMLKSAHKLKAKKYKSSRPITLADSAYKLFARVIP